MSLLPNIISGTEESLYNIGVVSRMTGISMATLRAWERRYNFPEANRTAGGHRLYSEKDVQRLNWVKERIDEGMQTAQAINALHFQEKRGNLTLVDKFPLPHVDKIEPVTPLNHTLDEKLLRALLNQDFERADTILGEVLAVSSPEALILDVIGPAFYKIGDAWEAGKINVASEHLATNYLRQRLLMWGESSPPPRSAGSIILACAPDEWHEGGLLILSALLRRRRWPVTYLGQAVPLQDLSNFLKTSNSNLLVFSAMTEKTAASLVEWPQWMPGIARSGRPIVVYGGKIFVDQPEWRIKMHGTYLGDTYPEAVENIEQLLG